MIRHKAVTLTGSVQRLSDELGFDESVVWLSIQPGASNGNAAYVGTTSAISSSDYMVRLEAASGGVPPAPWPISELLPAGARSASVLKTSDLYVLGTNTEKLFVGWIPST